jgi:hypothetical protein
MTETQSQPHSFVETHFLRTICVDCGLDSGKYKWFEKYTKGPMHTFFSDEEKLN